MLIPSARSSVSLGARICSQPFASSDSRCPIKTIAVASVDSDGSVVDPKRAQLRRSER
jgi:hypothetical protein